VRDLDTDDAVYILEDMEEADKQEVLDKLSPAERIVLQQGLDYPENSAGRRMQSEVVAVPPFWTVGQTIDYLRRTEMCPNASSRSWSPTPRIISSARSRSTGCCGRSGRSRSRARRGGSPRRQGDRRHRGRRADVPALQPRRRPVIDDAGRLVGVLTIDDIVDVIEEAADDDVKQLGGVNADEELSDPVPQIAKSRFRWLFVNLVTSFLAAAVMSLFEAQLSKLVALAILAPIVASQGGNAATQTMTVAVRALATQELGAWNLRRFFTRE
jgi:magnesium transporter